VQGAMAMDDGRPRRRTGRREEERSPTPVSDGTAEEEEDDEEEGELGTADLTLDILRKARLRGLPRKEGEKTRNGDGGDATFGGRAAMDGGRSLRVWEEARAVADVGPLEDGEIITNDAEEEVDALAQLEEPPPVAAATGKKKRKKSGKKKKEVSKRVRSLQSIVCLLEIGILQCVSSRCTILRRKRTREMETSAVV
jgi:hypothetical protein